jgi:hypothetical protein
VKRLALSLVLVGVVGCSSPEFAPDAIISSAGGDEIAVRSWEFCGPADESYECLDSLPGDDLPVLVVQTYGSWIIDGPTGYEWDVWYRVGEPDDSAIVLSLQTRTGGRVVEIPQPGRYLVEMRGRTDETVGAWTFELVIEG